MTIYRACPLKWIKPNPAYDRGSVERPSAVDQLPRPKMSILFMW